MSFPGILECVFGYKDLSVNKKMMALEDMLLGALLFFHLFHSKSLPTLQRWNANIMPGVVLHFGVLHCVACFVNYSKLSRGK